MSSKLEGLGLTEQEKAVLKECRRRSIMGGITWGVPSLLPLWAVFRAKLLPRFLAPPSYTVAFVLFSLLGSMSKNDSCIDSILDTEDSQLAQKIRKSMPSQAQRYDKRRRFKTSITTDNQSPTDSASTEAPSYAEEQSGSSWDVEREEYRGGTGAGNSGSGEWMQRQDDKRAVRRNKYGDIVFNDVK